MKKVSNILRFYLLATSLKDKIRQGSIYWNVSAPRRESVAEHIYDTCILAIAIESEYNLNVDLGKVLTMLLIHELEEIVIGDITPFDNISEQEKLEMGKKAVIKILEGLQKEEEYISLTNEFNLKKTKEAKFAYMCDKLDFDIQMKLYTDKGYITLDDSLNTPVYKNQKIRNMIDHGATSPSDIFYQYDLPKYIGNGKILNILNYAYSLDLNSLIKKYMKDVK